MPIENRPLLFHLFEKFEGKKFIIICDYKSEVLEKYLQTFASEISYELVKTDKKGTCSGIRQALDLIPQDEPFILSWCDLLFSQKTEIPNSIDCNLIALSKSFECRWSFDDNQFTKTPSKEKGVAGLFLLKNKQQIIDVGLEGEFVLWLQNNKILFDSFNLVNAREVGTMLSYNENDSKEAKCRPFNKMIFEENYVTKIGS